MNTAAKGSIKSRIDRMQRTTLILFFILSAAIYLLFFGFYQSESYKKELTRRAESIASELPLYLKEEAAADAPVIAESTENQATGRGQEHGQGEGRQGGMMGQGMKQGMMGQNNGMGSYLRFLDDFAKSSVWVVDQNANSILTGRNRMHYDELPEGATTLVAKVYEGETVTDTSFQNVLDDVSMTVGVPIRNEDGQVMAALLLHGSQRVETSQLFTALGIMVGALVIALGISSFASHRLTTGFSTALSKMSDTAQKLTEGDYTAKSLYRSEDEFGRLAGNLDELADRLAESKRIADDAEEQRRSFLASISHELRTPVTVIRGSLEGMTDGIVKDPERMQSYSKQMLQEVLQLERLVNDLMDLTKMQHSSFPLQNEVVQLSDIISDSLRSMRRIAEEKGIRIASTSNVQAPVWGDYTRLKQMLSVVIDNAIKFSSAGDEILIDSHRSPGKPDTILVSVTDRGKGIEPDEIPLLFSQFYTRAEKSGAEGTGLGLAIAKSIADRHGITIKIDSTIGVGTTFTFEVPITDRPPE